MLHRTHHKVEQSLFARPRILITTSAPPFNQVHGRAFASVAQNNDALDVAILGGGVTGLASAYYLTQRLPHARVTIYEASDRLGGWLSSKRVPVKDGTVLFEAGPRTLRPNGNGVLSSRLLQELDLAKDGIFAQRTSPAARNRYLYYPDRIVRMPHPSFGLWNNILTVLSEPAFEGTPWAFLTESWKPLRDPSVTDESIGDFLSRRFCSNTVDRIASAVFHGIYAGDVWQLSAKSLLGNLWQAERRLPLIAGMLEASKEGELVSRAESEHRQEMKEFQWDPLLRATLKDNAAFTFKDGLTMLTDGMVRHLRRKRNVKMHTSASSSAIEVDPETKGLRLRTSTDPQWRSHTHVISTLSPSHLNLLDAASSTLLVPHIPSVTVMTVNLYYRTPGLNPPGFGYLIPLATPFENNPERALGVVFDTAYSPSPKDVDMSNWHVTAAYDLQRARDAGQLVNVNDFAWYNLPAPPHIQDHVPVRGSKLTVMLGGHHWNGWPDFPSEQEGLALAKSLLRRHLNITEEPEAWQVNLQRDCIPQYTVGHEQRLQTAHNRLWQRYRGRLRVAGSWMAGVGVNDCLRSALDVVRGIQAGKDGTGLEHVGRGEFVRSKPWMSDA